VIATLLLLAATAMNRDGVLRYVPPSTVNGGGKVVVTVVVAPDGTVERIADAQREGADVAEEVKRWQFAPTRTKHVERVTFIVHPTLDTDCDGGLKSWYVSPLTLHVQPVNARGDCLQRVNGAIPSRECELHHVPMSVERLPVRMTPGMQDVIAEDGLSLPEKQALARDRLLRSDYVSHMFSDFPHGRQFAGWTDLSPAIWRERYVCPRCREAEMAWREAHPGFEP